MGGLIKVLHAGKLGRLVACILISEGTGVVSALLSMNGMQKYPELQLPAFAPPGWVFPVVWSILFLLMGIACYLIWMKGIEKRTVRDGLTYYGVQLGFNFFWTIIFFRFELHFLAFIWIIFLLFFIILTTFQFFRVKPAAGYLMVPYIVWVAFATYLNYMIWVFNKS